MSNIIEDVNKELKELCSDYLNILQHLKKEGIINQDTFEACADKKLLFLEE
ncbi:hypothetical protein [Romboutsia sp.]|uniref:hypothetical protein n=1 Tax=Romboutsia sp. TaxID=1965302 RepID=UPI003F3E65B7